MIVSVNIASYAVPGQSGTLDPGRMVIMGESSSSFIKVPYAPREVDYSNLAATWEQIDRSGRTPLLLRSSDPLPTMSFTLTLGNTQDQSIESELRFLAQQSRYNQRLRVIYSSWEHGMWRINSMTMRSSMRDPVTNEITRAEMDIEFILASDISDNLGPVSGGVTTPPGGGLTPIGGASGGAGGSTKIRTYKVKKGDTLHKISIKFYRKASRWKDIAKANKIKNPRENKALKVGRNLKIPA